MRTRSHVKPDPDTLSHSLINKLSAISGQCQLMREDLPKDAREYPRCLERLLVIQETANAMADEIKAGQRTLNAMKKAG